MTLNRMPDTKTDNKRCALVLAAGKSTRFKSTFPKVVHHLCGQPLIVHILEKLRNLDLNKTFVVVGHDENTVRDAVAGYDVDFVVQEEPLGTGHAVISTAPFLDQLSGSLLVIPGDTPMIRLTTLERLFRIREEYNAAEVVLTAVHENPYGYGRIIRNRKGVVVNIVEEKDATTDQKKLCEINAGVACFEIAPLLQGLSHLSQDNTAREYYLTDLVRIFCSLGHTVVATESVHPDETLGINSLEDLAWVEEKLTESRV